MNLEQAFTDLAKKYSPLIYKACYLYSDTIDEIPDYFQEILINLWKGYPNFRNESNISTWIYRVSVNTCISYIRKTKKHKGASALPFDLTQIEDAGRLAQIQELYKVINLLNKYERTLIWLWLEEKTYEEIAEITGYSKSNVGVRLMRVKDKLKMMLKE